MDEGFLHFMCKDLDGLPAYWDKILADFPQHPVRGRTAVSFPMTLYGYLSPCLITRTLVKPNLKRFDISILRNQYLGDEGQALNGSWMNFHFQFDLSPWLGNSAVSRFLISTIPSSM